MYLVSYIWVPTIVFVEGMIEVTLWDYRVNGSKISVFPKHSSIKLMTAKNHFHKNCYNFVEQNHKSILEIQFPTTQSQTQSCFQNYLSQVGLEWSLNRALNFDTECAFQMKKVQF